MAFETINNTDRLEPTSRDKVNNNFAKCLEKTNNLSDVATPNDALNNLLPEQSVGTSGQVLTSDGEDAFWDTPAVLEIATTTSNGAVTLSKAPSDPLNPVVVETSDTRVPSQGENDALVGTSGTPSSSNKYVTNDDTATTGANKVLRLTSGGKVTTSTLDTGTSANQIVQLDASAKLPAVDGSALTNVMTYNNGSTTRDLTASSGTVNVAHGLGKTPKRVVIKTIVSSSIVGDGIYSNGKFISRYWSAVGAGVSNTLYVYTGAGTGQSLSISVDETNIIFSWTKEGSPSGTVYILWEVE